jgi:hypothetical protein
MASTSAFAPVDRVIALAMSTLEGADTIDRAYFKEWVYEGMKQLGPSMAWYNEAILYPTELAFRKPTDMYSLIDVALFDSADTELRFSYRGLGSRIHESDNSLLNSDTYAPTMGAPIDLSEDGYYLHLGSNGGLVAYAKVKYWKFPVDENNELIVPEDDVFCLALFCRYCFYMRKDDKMGAAQGKNSWLASRNERIGARNMPTILEGTEIARTWNSMIKKIRFKKF